MKLEQQIESVIQQLTNLIAITYELGEDVQQKSLRLEGLRDDIKLFQGKLGGLRERQQMDLEEKEEVKKDDTGRRKQEDMPPPGTD